MLRKLLGFLAALICYTPIILLALWLGKGGKLSGLIAAGLFVFFGFILCMAVYGAVGIPDKDGSKKPAEKEKPLKAEAGKKKSTAPMDAGTSILAHSMANTDTFDGDDGLNDE